MITPEQVKEDIKAGKSTRIYYSAHTRWWTHLDSDVEEATKQGKAARDERHKKMMDDPEVPQEHKEKLSSLFKTIQGGSTPIDPTGSPLFQSPGDPMQSIETMQHNAEHVLGQSIEIMMKAHHQNCEGFCSASWLDYHDIIKAGKI